MNEEFDTLLNDLYYNKKNFDGATVLHKKAKAFNNKITLKYVTEWLKAQSTHQQTTRRRVGKNVYKKIVAPDHHSYQMDLTFLPRWKSQNKNNYVLFTAININSRYAYAYYGKDKATSTIIDMLNQFKKDAKIITNITSDSGSEFRSNKIVTKWFSDNDITMYFVVGDSHVLGIVNRFHRTLKEKLLKYFTANDTTTWIDVLDTIINNYNNTDNRGIGMTPKEASEGLLQSMIINRMETYNDSIGDIVIVRKGDNIRIKKKRAIFDKGQTMYTDKVYEVDVVKPNSVILSDGTKVKKDDLIVVNDVQRHTPNIAKAQVEKTHKVRTQLKRIDVDEENVIEAPRQRKAKNYDEYFT
jgi:hypothetical protein